jgi:hypothetical protein
MLLGFTMLLGLKLGYACGPRARLSDAHFLTNVTMNYVRIH